MPKNKDFKQIIRSRMQKTGESYTAARSQLLRKKATDATALAKPVTAKRATRPAIDLSKAPMSDEAIRAKTGKSWVEWVDILDAIDATKLKHGEMTDYLHTEWKVPGWWTQSIAVGYERFRGLRDVGQRRGGGYEVNKSKTVPVPTAMLFQAFADTRTRNRWLPKTKLTIRGATAAKIMRITWADGTDVQVYFVSKGAGKSQVTIQHRKLASKDEAEKLRTYWSERLAALQEVLVPAPATAKRRAARR